MTPIQQMLLGAGGGYDPGTPGTVNQTNNLPISFGNPFTDNNGNYVTYAEFQNNGTEVLIQNLWGERKYNLSSAYDISSSSVSYKSGSINYWTIGQYNNDALTSYRSASGRVMRFSGGTTAYFYGGVMVAQFMLKNLVVGLHFYRQTNREI